MDREQQLDRAWRASAEVWPGAIARLLALVLVVLTPWIPAEAGIAAWLWVPALVVLVCWILTPELTNRGVVSLPTMLLSLGAVVLVALVQLAPLPTQTLASLSPTAQHWWELVDRAGQEPDPTGLALSSKLASHTVSLYPWGTKQSIAWMLFAAVFLLAGARFFRRSLPFVWLAVAVSFAALAAAAVGGYSSFIREIALLPRGFDATPLYFFGIALALGLLVGRGSAGKRAFGVVAFAICAVGLGARLDASALVVAAAGGAAVVVGLVAALMPMRRLTLLAICVVATAASWFVGSGSLRIPDAWQTFLRAGSGFGSASLLATDRAPGDPSPGSLISKAVVEGGWPTIILAALACWLFVEALVRLSQSTDRDDRAFLAAGLFLGPTSVAWMGFSHWVSHPYYLIAFPLLVGAIVGRAALNVHAPFTSISTALPRFLPAPTFGALLFAASLWAAFTGFAAERTRAALVAADLQPSQRANIAEVDEALLRLRPLIHHGDAVALYRIAERRIDRFRLQTAEQVAERFKLSPDAALKRIDESGIFSRANSWLRKKDSAPLESLRREQPVAQNLAPAALDLKAALAASPLVSEVALRNAQLRFMSETPVNDVALLKLAEERAAPHPELLFAIGQEHFFSDRIEPAAETWRRALDPSLPKQTFRRLENVIPLLGPKIGVPRLTESVLPFHPEAYLTLAEKLGNVETNAVFKVVALEMAEKALKSVELTDSERAFYWGRHYVATGNLPKAVDSFRTAVKDAPSNSRYRQSLAWALELKGDRPAALLEAQQALDAEPGNAELKAMVKYLQAPKK